MSRTPTGGGPSFRTAARAFLAATIVAFVAAVLLDALTAIVSVAAGLDDAPWWTAAHVLERGRWVSLALLLVVASRTLSVDEEHAAQPGAVAWSLVGRAVIVMPLLWIVAAWIVQATLFTIAARWDIDGQIFLSPGYYRGLLVGYVPWFLGGAATVAASRHVT